MRKFTPTSAGYEPRVEMTPLLDVIFLLLTFFIYSLVLTVHARILPVKLPSISTGKTATDTKIAAITVDAAGHFYLNAKPATFEQLHDQLADLAKQPHPPVVYLALDSKNGDVDRGPTLIRLIDTLRTVGLPNFYIVGQPDTAAPKPGADHNSEGKTPDPSSKSPSANAPSNPPAAAP